MFARTIRRFRPALLGAAGAALALTATTALAGSGVGGVFNLGVGNTVDGQTSLTGNPGASPLLKVTSNGTAAAVRGVATNGIGTNGVSTSGVGQQGISDSGTGALGTHGNNTGVAPGVQGETNSTDPAGAGVVGKNNGGGPGLKSIVLAGAPPLAVNSSVKVANFNADLLDGIDSTGFWKLSGNAGTNPATNFLGTSDNQALELKVNGQRALRLEPNASSPNLIGGYFGNEEKNGPSGVTISGGGASGAQNVVTDSFGSIGGGYGNAVGDFDADPTTAADATVAGGFRNTASGVISAVAGGENNTASVEGSVIGGGEQNSASGIDSTVTGGFGNTASGSGSIVAGENNTSSGGLSAVAGGQGNTASGAYSTVASGFDNTAGGDLSFAAGTHAQATQSGSFVWGDSTTTDLASPAPNTFTVRASGGIWLGTNSSPSITSGHFIDTSTGAYLTSTGTWTNNSDRAKKYDLRSLDSGSVLHRIARMPITSWTYKGDPASVRHIGPMAQDFYKAFGLGLDNRHITTVDEGGVALAAIKGLYRQNQALERRVARLERELRTSHRATQRSTR